MRKMIAVLSMFAIVAMTFVSSGSNGGTTVKTDYGGYVLSIMSIDELIAVAENATISTDICLKETSTFERKEEASPNTFDNSLDLAFCPLFGPNDWSVHNQDLDEFNRSKEPRTITSSGHNSIKGARLKIVLPALC